jgi:hypothetical protein
MVKPILAIAAAAACAGLVVLAPEFAPKSAMAATQSGEAGAPMQADVVAKEKQQSDRGCAQHWPYYKQSWLRDARLSNGTERVVRVIAIDRTSND